jgi:hypothetical protein
LAVDSCQRFAAALPKKRRTRSCRTGLRSSGTAFNNVIPGNRGHRVFPVACQGLGKSSRDMDHEIRNTAIETVHRLREIQRFLYRPDLVMSIRRENLCRIANHNPSEWHCCGRRDPTEQLNNCASALPHGRMTAPKKAAAAVAINTCSSITAPTTWALGANQAMISDYAGIHERLPRITVFSMTTQFRPIRILPPSSATIRAPCKNAGTGAENYNSAKEWHPVRPTPRSQSLDVCQNAQLT